jgi:hypothetical protein
MATYMNYHPRYHPSSKKKNCWTQKLSQATTSKTTAKRFVLHVLSVPTFAFIPVK